MKKKVGVSAFEKGQKRAKWREERVSCYLERLGLPSENHQKARKKKRVLWVISVFQGLGETKKKGQRRAGIVKYKDGTFIHASRKKPGGYEEEF